jgi:hypothetical protein
MTLQELEEVVAQRMTDPRVLGRLACNIRSSDLLHQRHHDGRSLVIEWRDTGDTWRAVISVAGNPSERIAQVDLNENSSVRVEAFEPCSVTISPEDGLLCLTRYKPEPVTL